MRPEPFDPTHPRLAHRTQLGGGSTIACTICRVSQGIDYDVAPSLRTHGGADVFLRPEPGIYVEFNLLREKGTYFGLQSGGNIEAIRPRVPPFVGW